MRDLTSIRTDNELLATLAPGDTVEAVGQDGRHIVGSVDVVAAELGVIWIYQLSGDRQLLDTSEHHIIPAT
ncbi:hypothetical protein [Arthrobacter sp. SAFR-044]|uniref:hypothetical protein n=1 Tax=Arthrobacter sp. SAFR-044 TaxID=3387278 RepID=UPI003F7B8B3A